MQRFFSKAKRLLCVTMVAVMVSSSLVSQNALAFSKVIYANADPWKYYIELDLTNKVTSVYERDKDNKYSKLVKQFISTTGTDETPTPEGTYVINDARKRFGYFTKFDVYAQYWTNVIGGIYFHSILYTQPKEGYFTTTSYNALGKQSSHGCIRLLVEDARWIYYNCPSGTRITMLHKKKDDALRQSLLPTKSAKNYHPTADEYEAVGRDYARAILSRDSTFTPVGKSPENIEKGTIVKVLSSGGKACRVKVGSQEGHISTIDLTFYPNGLKDPILSVDQKEIYLVSVSEGILRSQSSATASILGKYGKGTTVKVSSETKNFYGATIDGKTGYIAKDQVRTGFVPLTYKNVVKSLATPTPAPTPTPTAHDEDVDVVATNAPTPEPATRKSSVDSYGDPLEASSGLIRD